MSKVLLIGDIVIDVTLKSQTSNLKLRLGGIVHAARSLWALNIPYSVGYFSPSFLNDQISHFLVGHGCSEVFKLGDVIGAPYVFLIEDVKEIGNQGYEFLLRDEVKINYDLEMLDKIFENQYDDILLISGNYDQIKIINGLTGNIHIDVANNIEDLTFFSALNKKLNTIFVSTSSTIFHKYFNDSFKEFTETFKKHTEKVILKENRGGSRGFDFAIQEAFSASAQLSPIKHSVGVGDVFDACFVVNNKHLSNQESLVLSSWVASEYAQTTYPDDFKRDVNRVLKSNVKDLVNILGASIPWERRKEINIYIAAPDFSYIDTTHIDTLSKSLKYHNFSPRRPVLENGQMEIEATKARKQELFQKDMILLDNCSILIAVLLFNDPGTLIEIGLASAKGIPTIVYDPYSISKNCMLTELPHLITHDMDLIISEIFNLSSKFNSNEK
ncbi:nucleoside 2-deoxyribosyltransferase [Pedobacter cryoconitis]|uniref:nucleoside 2-deoxyribosyltransferase n=1 Tax=Pedobacter cryoconitis TaxID=188932 RepID=UPI0016130EE2|nr:nucleoside 2-deoxyribosyltransferase [Pedobacter cryoconitis]MBB5644892.1 nucleoside 2-deoxyribosyltransferase [Pedobacter cryoconitis]